MRRWHLFLITLTVVSSDLITKLVIRERLAIGDVQLVLDGWFNIVHVRNPGVVFGIGTSFGAYASWVVVLVTSLIASAVLVMALRTPMHDRATLVGLHLVLGGALGNILNRLALGAVVDFLDVYVRTVHTEYHWPAFNVADIAVCAGIAVLLWTSLRPHHLREART